MGRLRDYHAALLDHYGPRKRRPSGDLFEVLVGAVLAKNTAWKNVEKAIKDLKTFELLDVRKIHELDQDTLALAIKPAGTSNVKAARLKALVAWYLERYGGDPERLKKARPDRLREELLEIQGIGPETADAILLHALEIPTFVVDTNAYRVLTRHELALEEATYDELKETLEKALPRDAATIAEMHALLGAVGKEYCRPKALCDQCPLKPFLPGSQPPAGAPNPR
ncbi:MAG TPA: endonuclease III domain-containing protein [Planctomycetota bacterium]|nr:endonuclease III domain-containing protein [Planctomycetota bacterium]